MLYPLPLHITYKLRLGSARPRDRKRIPIHNTLLLKFHLHHYLPVSGRPDRDAMNSIGPHFSCHIALIYVPLDCHRKPCHSCNIESCRNEYSAHPGPLFQSLIDLEPLLQIPCFARPPPDRRAKCMQSSNHTVCVSASYTPTCVSRVLR